MKTNINHRTLKGVAAVVTLLALSVFAATASAQGQNMSSHSQGVSAPAQAVGNVTERITLKGIRPDNNKEKANQVPATPNQGTPPSPAAASSSNYVFATNTSGTFTVMTGSTQLIAASQDDTASVNTPIGFDFWLQGVRYTQFSATSNGFVGLSSTGGVVSTGEYSIADGTAALPLIAACGGDLETGTAGKVHYKVTGAAPSRVLTVEFLNMGITYNNVTSDGTFQVRLSETTGLIEFVYGSMSRGPLTGAGVGNGANLGIGFSVAAANGSLVSIVSATNTATTTTPFTQQAYATGPIANLDSPVEGSRRVYSLTPPVLLAPTGLTFAPVTAGSIQLNWTDTNSAPNEQGYVIYRSVDGGLTYSFAGQTAADAVLFNDTGLSPSTTYFYRVFAVSEGALSAAASGSTTTPPAGNISSTGAGGLWSAPATWSGGVVPTATDNVTIANGTTVTIDTAAVCFNLTVGGGASGILQYQDTATARSLTATVSVTINAGGTFTAFPAATVTGSHTLSLTQDLINNGTMNFNIVTGAFTSSAQITFTSANAAAWTLGAASSTNLKQTTGVSLNKGTNNVPVLTFTPGGTFTVAGANTAGFLSITNGTFKISGSGTFSNPVFSAAAYSIPATGGFWLNNANYTVVGQNGNATMSGLLRLTAGIFNSGNTSGNIMGGATTSSFIIEGATMNIASRLVVISGTPASFNMSSGTVNVTTVGNATTASPGLGFTSATSSFTMSGGTINLVQASTGATPNDYNFSGVGTVTGGTLNVGTAATATNFNFRIAGNIPALVVDSTTNAKTATLFSSSVSGLGNGSLIWGNITINTGASLNFNPTTGFLVLFGGTSVTNNGSIVGTAAGSRFDFQGPGLNGTGAQSYSGTGTWGTAAVPFVGVGVGSSTTGGITLTAPIVTTRVNLFVGSFIGSGQITIGSGAALGCFVQRGSSVANPAGSFDVAPIFNLGTGAYQVSYAPASNLTTTSFEIPSTRTVTFLSIGNAAGVTLAGGGLAVSGQLILTTGNLTTTSSNLLTVTATATTGVSGGSATSFVNGPLARVLPLSLVTGSTYRFPVGKTAYNLFELVNPTTTSAVTLATVQAEAFDGNAGGTPGAGVSSLFTNRYWQASLTANSGSFTDTLIRLTDSPLGNRVCQSPTQTGTYNSIGGTVISNAPPSLQSGPATSTTLGFFVMGTVNLAGGTYTVGAVGGSTYPTLTAAIADVNSKTITGPVVLSLVDASYSRPGGQAPDAVGVETFPFTLMANNGGTASNTITIKPAPSNSPTITGSNATAIFDFNTAKFWVIDGSNTLGGTTKDLTISNTNTSGPGVRFINAASNNTVKNAILKGVSTSTTNGVVFFSTTASGTTGNSNNLIGNNTITGGTTATANGVYMLGTSTALGNANTVTGNTVNDFSAAGIYLSNYYSNSVFSLNTIFEVTTQTSTTLQGIVFDFAPVAITVTRNLIRDLNTTGAAPTIRGIYYIDGTSGDVANVNNNFITLDATTTTAGATIYGYDTFANGGTIANVYFNSIRIGGTAVTAGSTAGVFKHFSNITNLKDNIIVNARSNGAGTGKHYDINVSSSSNLTTLTSDFNDLFVSGTGGFVGFDGTADRLDLTAWRTNTGKDLNSIPGDPVFVSPTNLHLTSASSPANAHATVIAGITTDFDGETRSTVTPDIGADEVNVAGSLQFSPTGYSVGEAGPTVTLQVTRTGGTDGIVGCTFNTADGTAVAPGDYTAQVNGTLSWVDNDTANKTIVIPITNDSVFELSEAFTTKLTLPTGGATIGANDTATITITDDDTAPVFTIDSVSHNEGNVGTNTNYVFTITKTGVTAVSSSVHVQSVDGTAVSTGAAFDFTALPDTTLTFPASATTDTQTVTVVVKGDNTFEPNETFTVPLSSPTNATIGGAGTGTGTIVNDDPVPPPAIFPIGAGTPTASDNDYTRIRDAVRDANDGDTIRLEGTFNWTEPNALISWSKGTDGITGTTDDYSILVRADLNGVTFTGESVGAGHPPGVIQGPGDLAGVDLEGVLFFNSVTGSKNQGWTIKGVQFLDFDMAIFMQSDQTALDAFNNTHITGNSIRMAKDLKEDASQNIAIFFSFGTNQLISGNAIDIQGDGSSTFPSGPFAADVAIQGQNAVGALYNGLQITNNTIHVLHHQVPTTATSGPEDIIGIWENGSANASNITISGNSFTNLDPLNDPALNFQIGFRVNSHSSATTTVGYLNNTVSGANLGFEWLGGTNFSGNQAVKLTSNTITGNATGVQVKSQGVADLSFNRIVDNSVNGLNNVDGTVTALNNWWGCNAGPGNAGCDSVVGAPAPDVALPPVVTSPRIVVGASAAPATITPGGTSTVTADMTHNSAGTPLGVVTTVPSMPVGYTATHGTMNPVTDTIVSGTDTSLFTSTDSTNAVATVTVDHQAVDAPIGITQPSFTINDVTHAEGNAGTTSFTFTITKTGSTTFSTSVDYATVDGSATSPSDFTAVPATTVTFLSTDTTKQVTILVNGDTTIEADEAFTVHLSNSVSATIADADGTGAIINDDVPSFSIDDVTHFEGSGGGTTSYTFTISKTAGAMVNATVDYATVDGTATSPSDFTAIPTTTLTFLPADLTKQVTVSVNADNTFEPNETFNVHLSNPNNATISDADGLGTINNDDASPTPTATPPPTATPTPTPVPTATPTPGPCSYVYSVTTGNTIVPGTVDVGNHTDDGSTTVTLPFSYQLYDQTFTTAKVGSNGYMAFDVVNNAFGVTCIPVATATYAIGPFWGDQCTDNTPGNCSNLTGLGIFTSTSGTAPNRIFNIEWRTTYFGGSLPLNYEVRLFENPASGAFDVIYGTVNTITGNDSQLSAGVQKGPGAAGFTQVFCDTTGGTAPGVSAGQRYHYTLTPCPTPTPTSTPASTATPGCPAVWSAGANFTPPPAAVRSTGIYFPNTQRFYVMGGRSTDTAGSDFTTPYEYNPANDTWTTKAAVYPDNQVNNMACGVLTVSGTAQIYCVGGSAAGAATSTARVFSYNPVTDTIATLVAGDNWTGNAGGTNLPGGFTVFQNKLYILGGFTIGGSGLNSIYQFDPTLGVGAKWALKTAVLPVPLAYVPATTIGTLIFTGGGSTVAAGALTDSTNSYVYNPVGDAISALGNQIPRATGETRAVTVGGKMWVLGGGRTAPNPSNEVDIYDPSSGLWSLGQPFAGPRRNFAADSDGTRVFLTGGYDNTGIGVPINTTQVFASPATCATPTPTPSPTPGGGTPTPTCAPVVTVSGALDAGDPTQTNRLFRGGIASACGAPNVCSTIAGTGFHYDSYSFVNTSGTTACITATTTTACTGTPFIYIGAYVNSFDPANICTNNVGDPGLSPDGITPSVFSFNVPAGATFLIVVSEVTAGSGCSAYSVDVSGLPCGPTPTPGGGTATPSPTPGGGTPTPTATISGTATPTPTPCNAGLGSWTIAANYPAVIEAPAVGSDGTFAYSAAGNVGGVASSGFYRYDPVANSWSTLASMPTGLYATRGVYAANTNTFYVFGGYDGTNVLTTTNRYNVGTGTWTTGAPMPAGRYFSNMVYYAATGKIYVIGGFDSSFTEANQTWEYDPVANTWNTTRLNIPVAMAGSGASIVGQFVYLAGTWGGGAGSTLHYRYDITGNTWSLMTAVPVAMYAPATGAIGSQIYVIGGGNASRPGGGEISLTGMRTGSNAPDASYNTTYIYNVAGNSWTTGPNTNVAHSFTAGAAIGSRLIIVGGYNGTADTNTVEVNGVAGCGTPTPTPTPGGPTPTPTATPACTPNYNFTLGAGVSIPGTTRIDGVGCDDCLSPLTIPFPVTIYGTSFTTGQVGSNGILAFGTAGNAFAGSCLPVASTTNELMPFYRDQRTDCTAGCGIFTATTGSAPNRVFTVEYKTIYFGETSTTPTNDYEVNFYESGSTAFDYTYALMHTTTQTGRITSIGTQNSATLFKQFACDATGQTPPVTTGQRLSWTFGGCGTPTPTPTATPPTTPTPTATATPPATPTPTATATPPATPTPTPVVGTPTPTATAAATATPSPTATPTSATHAINLSTRMRVQVGNEVGIGGFIVTGNVPKHVIVRAIGPSLSRFGIPDVLADPVLELHGPSGFATVINDNWRDTQEQEIRDTGIPPTDDLESAIVAVLNPGAYTGIVRGKNNTSGVALIEVYDLDSVGPNQSGNSRLANLSTRAFVSTGDNIVIAGFLLSDEVTTDRVIVRGLGPSLAPGTFPASAVLANPTLELRDANGTLIRSNNDWQDNASQAALITAAGLALTNSLESGIAETLPPGLYTALLAGLNNGTGIGLVEVYDLGQ